ncbi:TIGR02466 family protein [Hirschia maritima]|uniref:TIGR02466 family protein n=1 Tax=Hirschia maritima TaxID=1121961 RepID=UPI00039C73D0|nr:TIGR02466 family protein [Hirschia maritima]
MSVSEYSSMKLKAQRGMLFETPIVSAHLDNSDKFLTELKKVILEKRASDADGLKRSNIGGWHSDTDMMSWGGLAAKELSKKVIALTHRMSHFADAKAEKVKWNIQMWANITPKGGSNHIHVHPGNLWSAVLYVDMGGIDDIGDNTTGLGGEFYFEDPRFPTNSMHHPGFRVLGMDNKPQSVQPEIRPKRGDILMFPSWLKHGVRPYNGDKERISIAINLDPQ